MTNDNEHDIMDLCDYCDNRATQICPGCGAMICDEHDAQRNVVTPTYCRICGKRCPFDHDVPGGETVCDVCAGATGDDVDW